MGDVDPGVGELGEHPPAEPVVTDDADERDPEPELRRADGRDRRRSADRLLDRGHHLFVLAEARLGPGHDDVRIDVADDDQVERPLRHPDTQPSPGMSGWAAISQRSAHGRP